MKHSLLKYLMFLAWFGGGAFATQAQNSAFTYQGRLTANGGPVNGNHDFQFTLFGAPSGGNPLSATVSLPAIGVSNGIFTASLDFGAEVFTGSGASLPGRWLAIAVRPAGNGAFAALNPRQALTPTPYALTAVSALNVPGVDGHSLHAADGSPANAVVVDNTGNVGVGTTIPASRFHVDSASGDLFPPRLESSSTTRFNAGWDFYHGGTGKGYVGVPDTGAGIAPGEMLLYGGPGMRASLWSGGARSLTADAIGNIGIGTTNPVARLHVQGEVRIGPNGRLLATGGDENLRILRGTINAEGTVVSGVGVTCTRMTTGTYVLEFADSFSNLSIPVVTANVSVTGTDTTPVVAMFANTTVHGAYILLRRGSDGSLVNRYFNFMVIGQPDSD